MHIYRTFFCDHSRISFSRYRCFNEGARSTAQCAYVKTLDTRTERSVSTHMLSYDAFTYSLSSIFCVHSGTPDSSDAPTILVMVAYKKNAGQGYLRAHESDGVAKSWLSDFKGHPFSGDKYWSCHLSVVVLSSEVEKWSCLCLCKFKIASPLRLSLPKTSGGEVPT